MRSRSVFITAIGWWLLGAAVVGAIYPFIVIGTDSLLSTGTSDALDSRLWRAVLLGAGIGLLYGVVPALANASLSALLQKRPQALVTLTRLVAGISAALAVWRELEASPDIVERTATTIVVAFLAWAIAPAIAGRYRSRLAPDPRVREIDEPPTFQPTHMLTSAAHSEDVDAFVRDSLRTYGRGNALFTVEAGGIAGNSPSTQILVDAGGTGHVLNLDMKRWERELAEGAEELAGFVVTDDRTLALAPAGLSAAAVISEGISLVQKVSGDSNVKVQFEGFGH